MVLPPLSDGADHVTVAVLLEVGETVWMDGVPGIVKGVTDEDEDEYDPVPTPLVAAILKV